MITVLMATYNGADYVAEQLDSLLGQTLTPDRILIHDDKSTDETVSILHTYQQGHPQLIEVVVNQENLGGSARNFMSMITSTRDDYLMLCDQDDVWMPDKIERTHARMMELEDQWGKDSPCMVHTDLRVVGEDLTVQSNSFKENTFANWDRTALRDQIIQNTAAGCTMMYNRALAELMTAIPAHMVMHDWWISLVTAAFGHLGYIEDQTILYRQHESNQIGVTDMRKLTYKLHRLLNPAQVRADIRKTYPQAQEFLDLYKSQLSEEQLLLLSDYCSIPTLSKLGRISTVARLGTWKTGLSRNIAYLLFI